MSALTLAFSDDENTKPSASFITVTPETAARWLRQNSHNRTIREYDLDRYRRDMLAGEWHLDGAPIRFGTDGALLDGQHRLTAIVQTGVTLPLLVVRGIAPGAQSVMDTGRRRTASDALSIEGHENAALLAGMAALAIKVQTGKLDAAGNRTTITHSEVLNFVNETPESKAACEFASKYARKTDCAPSMVAYTYMILSRIDAAAAARFWIDAAEKVGLSEGDPVIALTNRFAEARRMGRKLSQRVALSAIYRAWNYRRTGKPMHIIRTNSAAGGLIPIPEPK